MVFVYLDVMLEIQDKDLVPLVVALFARDAIIHAHVLHREFGKFLLEFAVQGKHEISLDSAAYPEQFIMVKRLVEFVEDLKNMTLDEIYQKKY